MLKIRKPVIPILITVFLMVNTVLTFTDQMGVYDWIVLLLNLAALVLSFILAIKRYRSLRKI